MSFPSDVADFESDAHAPEEYNAYYVPFDEELDDSGLDPATATDAKPGSEGKVAMLAARYAAGLPLWHGEDCYDHGPGAVVEEEDGRVNLADLFALDSDDAEEEETEEDA